MINAIPKGATGAGIGMFLAIIGLREMGWIQDDGAPNPPPKPSVRATSTSMERSSMVALLALRS